MYHADELQVRAPLAVRAHTTWLYRISPLLVFGLIVLAITLTYLIGAQAGVVTVAVGCAVAGTLRAALPEGSVPFARTAKMDVIVLYALAVLLIVLVPYAGPGLDQPIRLP